MREVVIVGGARTPIGSFLGSLAPLTATELGAVAIKEALQRAGVGAGEVGEVYMGCVLPAGLGQAPARQAALAAGLPRSVPCTTVNKVCGSGLKTVQLAAQAIATGECDIAVAGGMESMSNTPFLLKGVRTGIKMGNFQSIDGMVHDGLWDVYNQKHMGNCAELCAKEHKISREAQDAFAAESYRRALAAVKSGAFADEIAKVEIKTRAGVTVVDTDEEPGKGDIDKLPKLRPAFDAEGTITAGNASSLNDGAAAVVLVAKDVAVARKLPILGRIVASGGHAQDPEWFTTAPAQAIRNACSKAGWQIGEVDLWEINEAFSVVSLVNNQLLGLDAAKVDVNGGAVALGHPIGASGTRVLVTLLYGMRARNAKRGGAALCIGGGEAFSLLVERV